MDSQKKSRQKQTGDHAKQAVHSVREQVKAGTSMERQQVPKSGEPKQKEGHPKSGKK
jgi:hypothetical protein